VLPLNVVALPLPSCCLLVARSFVQLLMFVQLKGQGEQVTEPIQLKITPMMSFFSFRRKIAPKSFVCDLVSMCVSF